MAVSDVSSNNNSYIEILKSFNRNTTINDVQGLMAKSLFMLYDLKDEISGKRDGKFDEKEWFLFEQFRNAILSNEQKNLKNKVNKSAIKYYKKQVEQLEKKVEELSNRYKELFKTDYFKEFNDYEVSHNLTSHGLKDEEKVPEGALLLDDIEPFGIGIVQKEKECFEGTYKKAYIEGFNKLTYDEQKEYIEKYQNALKWCKQVINFEENVLSKEIEKLHNTVILYNASSDGILNDNYRSEERCNEILERYKTENPYLNQIEDLENEISKERLKFKPNTTKIVELQNLLKGLYQVSEQWRLKFSTEEKNPQQTEKSQFSISGEVTGLHIDEEEDYFVTSPAVNINYGNERAGITINGSIDNKYPASDNVKDNSTQTVYKTGISTYYKLQNKFEANQNSIFIINPDYKMQNHELRLRYINTILSISENIRRMNIQEFNTETNQPEQNSKTSYVTNLNLSQQIGNTNIGGSVQISDEGTTYTANCGYNYSTKIKNTNLSLNPTTSVSYTKSSCSNSLNCFDSSEEQSGMFDSMEEYQQGNIYSANAGLIADLEYNYRNFNAGLSINDNISTQFPNINNTFNTTATAKYKNLGFSISDMNMYSSEIKSNTITAGINYSGKCGEIETAYSHTRASVPMMNNLGEAVSNITHGNKLTVTVKLFIDRFFNHKK